MEARPGLRGGAREPLREFQRMEMPGLGIAAAAEVDIGADGCGERVAAEPFDGRVAVVAFQLLDIGDLVPDEAPLVRGLDQAGAPVAVDAVPGDQALDQRLGFLGELPEVVRVLAAELLLQPILVAPLPRVELPAVPPRRAPADLLRFDEGDIDAGLGQVQRRGQSGVAAADDRDMRLLTARERRKYKRRIGGGSVERRDVDHRGKVATASQRRKPGAAREDDGHVARCCTGYGVPSACW